MTTYVSTGTSTSRPPTPLKQPFIRFPTWLRLNTPCDKLQPSFSPLRSNPRQKQVSQTISRQTVIQGQGFKLIKKVGRGFSPPARTGNKSLGGEQSIRRMKKEDYSRGFQLLSRLRGGGEALRAREERVTGSERCVGGEVREDMSAMPVFRRFRPRAGKPISMDLSPLLAQSQHGVLPPLYQSLAHSPPRPSRGYRPRYQTQYL